MLFSPSMDPARFHIAEGIFYVGDRQIPWGSPAHADLPMGNDLTYCWRTVEVPFESGDILRVSWSDGSYSDNYTRQSPDGNWLDFVESPLSVECAIRFADEEDSDEGSDISQGWMVVPQVLWLVNTLAAPRAVLNGRRSFF